MPEKHDLAAAVLVVGLDDAVVAATVEPDVGGCGDSVPPGFVRRRSRRRSPTCASCRGSARRPACAAPRRERSGSAPGPGSRPRRGSRRRRARGSRPRPAAAPARARPKRGGNEPLRLTEADLSTRWPGRRLRQGDEARTRSSRIRFRGGPRNIAGGGRAPRIPDVAGRRRAGGPVGRDLGQLLQRLHRARAQGAVGGAARVALHGVRHAGAPRRQHPDPFVLPAARALPIVRRAVFHSLRAGRAFDRRCWRRRSSGNSSPPTRAARSRFGWRASRSISRSPARWSCSRSSISIPSCCPTSSRCRRFRSSSCRRSARTTSPGSNARSASPPAISSCGSSPTSTTTCSSARGWGSATASCWRSSARCSAGRRCRS